MRNWIIFTIGIICIFIIAFIIYKKNSSISIEYTGLGESSAEFQTANKDIIFATENYILNSDNIEFIQRKITGGGSNPGWVISLLETQPNVFTGRVIVDDGVYQHPVTLKEETQNVFLGVMTNRDGRKDTFSMQKVDKNCVDEEKNILEYTLTGAYGATQFSGCGGLTLKQGK